MGGGGVKILSAVVPSEGFAPRLTTLVLSLSVSWRIVGEMREPPRYAYEYVIILVYTVVLRHHV